MCRLHTQFSFQTTLRTPLPFHKTCFKRRMWRWRYHRCYPSLWLFTFNLDSSHRILLQYVTYCSRCDCRVHFLYCFFIQRILCTKKNRPCGSQDSRKYGSAKIIPVLILSGWATEPVTKPVSCQSFRNRSSESLRHFCNKRCKRCDRRFCTFSGFILHVSSIICLYTGCQRCYTSACHTSCHCTNIDQKHRSHINQTQWRKTGWIRRLPLQKSVSFQTGLPELVQGKFPPE